MDVSRTLKTPEKDASCNGKKGFRKCINIRSIRRRGEHITRNFPNAETGITKGRLTSVEFVGAKNSTFQRRRTPSNSLAPATAAVALAHPCLTMLLLQCCCVK
ncbi:hypothetical protein PIB30_051999 [Stylosanthes scabra]|uniref:Uncharacterized protein n=1 Tax=Stylosanthes scabra TaxID=79078 RepID=A0ABU6UHY2_9FABA|nr:hypothetical protein [Stylosanthes scabra]